MAQGSVTMALEVERQQDVLVVSPHGRVTEIEAGQLQRELLALIDQGAQKLVINFGDVPFVTSSGLGALMVAHKRVRPQGGYVRVACAQPLVRQILDITKLTKLFGNYPTTAEAIASKS